MAWLTRLESSQGHGDTLTAISDGLSPCSRSSTGAGRPPVKSDHQDDLVVCLTAGAAHRGRHLNPFVTHREPWLGEQVIGLADRAEADRPAVLQYSFGFCSYSASKTALPSLMKVFW